MHSRSLWGWNLLLGGITSCVIFLISSIFNGPGISWKIVEVSAIGLGSVAVLLSLIEAQKAVHSIHRPTKEQQARWALFMLKEQAKDTEKWAANELRHFAELEQHGNEAPSKSCKSEHGRELRDAVDWAKQLVDFADEIDLFEMREALRSLLPKKPKHDIIGPELLMHERYFVSKLDHYNQRCEEYRNFARGASEPSGRAQVLLVFAPSLLMAAAILMISKVICA